MSGEAEAFKLILETKDRQQITWDSIADNINKKNGTGITGEQVKDFVQRAKVPFGGFLVIAIEEALKIPPRLAKSYKSFNDGDE